MSDRPTIPLRNPRGLDPTLTDVLLAALRDGREVTLFEAEYGIGVRVDGQKLVVGLAPESFDYPLRDGQWSDSERLLIDELLRVRKARQAKRSTERIGADDHTTAEGYDE
jgi:hypothetical protein